MTDHSGLVFHALARAHRNAISAGLTARGVKDVGSPHLLLVIRELTAQNGRPPSQRELADRLHISPATIATSLKSLERNGYAERHVDPADTRRNQISITRKAEQALKDGMEVFCAVDAFMCSGFSPEEMDQLNRLHQRMLENLYQIGGDKDDGSGPPPFPPNKVKEES